MDVRVNEARHEKATAPIGDQCLRMRGTDAIKFVAGQDPAISYHQSAVLMAGQTACWCVEDRGAKQLSSPGTDHSGTARLKSRPTLRRSASLRPTASCRADARARRTAKKIRSGVAGLSKETASLPPNAATPAPSASRTQKAPISGGPPGALLPQNPTGRGARPPP